MTKKDYISLARAIHDARREVIGDLGEDGAGDALAGLEIAEVRIANVLAADSPRFDRARFIEACETGSDKASATQARKASKAALKAQREDRRYQSCGYCVRGTRANGLTCEADFHKGEVL
jgi:hypothetical protein